MSEAEWTDLIQQAQASRPSAIRAETFLQAWVSDSRPALLTCDGSQNYVVKALQPAKPYMGRVASNEQIVGFLGLAIGAAVGNPALVDVPHELINLNQEMLHMSPGIAHGSLHVPDCTDRAGFGAYDTPENRPRNAKLAVLYGWMGVFSDHQVIFEKAPPHRVHSVDHGHFFPSGPSWTIHSLVGAPVASIDVTIRNACGLTNSDIKAACHDLTPLIAETVAMAVAIPPDTWGFPMPDRVAMADYLWTRLEKLRNDWLP